MPTSTPVLRDALVLIDPMQNPDGRARFVFQHLQGRAATPDPTPYNAEHDEPWPGGRSNHYLFDMNRDWFAQTQPETRGRIQVARDYWPHVNVDLHEQGGDNTYYFAPPADPLNPHITKSQIAAFDLFGRANGQRFDERGWPYFIREVYDSFYPGYGESWPIFQGSIGMTYEQASARGLSFARSDGTTAHLSRRRHAPLQRGHRHRGDRGEESRAAGARLPGVSQERGGRGREGARCASTCWCPATTRRAAALLATNLATQGIEVRRTTEPVKVGDSRVAGRRLSRVARAAVRPADPEPARAPHPAARRLHRAAGGTARAPAGRSDLRHHRVEPAAALRRRSGDERRGASTAKHEMLPTAYERRAAGTITGAREGRIPGALGIGRGRFGRRCACAGHPHAQRRRRVRAERPPLSDRHRDHPQRRQPGRPATRG